MILLSALLASLTGLVAGERPAQRAQVELSAVATVAQPGKAVARTSAVPADPPPRAARLRPAAAHADRQAPGISGRARLDLKQSWLF